MQHPNFVPTGGLTTGCRTRGGLKYFKPRGCLKDEGTCFARRRRLAVTALLIEDDMGALRTILLFNFIKPPYMRRTRRLRPSADSLEALIRHLYNEAVTCPAGVKNALVPGENEDASCNRISRKGQTGSGQDIILCKEGFIYKGFPNSSKRIRASSVRSCGESDAATRKECTRPGWNWNERTRRCERIGDVVAIPPWAINLVFQTVLKSLIEQRNTEGFNEIECVSGETGVGVPFGQILEKYTCLCKPEGERALFLGGRVFGYPGYAIFEDIEEHVRLRYQGGKPGYQGGKLGYQGGKRVKDMMEVIENRFVDAGLLVRNGEGVIMPGEEKSLISAEAFLWYFRGYLNKLRWDLIRTGITESEELKRCVDGKGGKKGSGKSWEDTRIWDQPGTDDPSSLSRKKEKCRDSFLLREEAIIISSFVADRIRNWFATTSALLRWLHCKVQFHHADPKAAQLFLRRDGTAVLGDFDKVSFTVLDNATPIRLVVASKLKSVAGPLSRLFVNEALARRYDCSPMSTPAYEEMAFLISMLVVVDNQTVFEKLFEPPHQLSVQEITSASQHGSLKRTIYSTPVSSLIDVAKLHRKLFSYKRVTGKRGHRPFSLGTPAKLTESVFRNLADRNSPGTELQSSVSVQDLQRLADSFQSDKNYTTCSDPGPISGGGGLTRRKSRKPRRRTRRK